MLDQVREVREREKRTDSIIFRGFGTDSVEVVEGGLEIFVRHCELSL